MEELKHLGKQSQEAVSKVDVIPWTGHKGTVVSLECDEFTSHCPVTKQPDFGKLEIRYEPDRFLVETKSLKLYLWQFRDQAEFNEKLVNKIASELFQQIQPRWINVQGTFNRRGGIGVQCMVLVNGPN